MAQISSTKTPKESPLSSDELARLFDRLPPEDIQAEMALLGSMIIAGSANIHLIGEILQVLDGPQDFARPSHGALYQVLVDLYDRNQSLDAVQIFDELRKRGLLEQVGGTDYVIQLAESVPVPDHALHYARIVRDKALRRQLIDAAGRILRDAYTGPDQADRIIDAAETRIFKLAEKRSADDPEQLIRLIEQTYEQLDKRHEEGITLTGLPTGLPQLDEYLSGLQKGDMIVLAARPSMGKTALALNIAEYLAFDNKTPVAVFSLEMSKQQLAQRILSTRSGVDAQRMRRNMLGPDEFRRLQDVVSEAYDAPMFIDDTPGLSILELRAKARRLYSRHAIQAIFIDYLQLMSSPGAENRQQEVSQISRGIKALARELALPVICLSQLNRNPEGRADNIPLLSDLRESGSIEQDADVVLMLHREEYYHKRDDWAQENPDKVGLAEVIIAKQRNGPIGVVKLHFNAKTTRFAPYHDPVGGYIPQADDDIPL